MSETSERVIVETGMIDILHQALPYFIRNGNVLATNLFVRGPFVQIEIIDQISMMIVDSENQSIKFEHISISDPDCIQKSVDLMKLLHGRIH